MLFSELIFSHPCTGLASPSTSLSSGGDVTCVLTAFYGPSSNKLLRRSGYCRHVLVKSFS